MSNPLGGEAISGLRRGAAIAQAVDGQYPEDAISTLRREEAAAEAMHNHDRPMKAADSVPAGKVEIPQYGLRKAVRALKIADIQQLSGGGASITPAEEGFGPFYVDHGYVIEHSPYRGGYCVAYADGYKSFIPAEAFEAVYTRVADAMDNHDHVKFRRPGDHFEVVKGPDSPPAVDEAACAFDWAHSWSGELDASKISVDKPNSSLESALSSIGDRLNVMDKLVTDLGERLKLVLLPEPPQQPPLNCKPPELLKTALLGEALRELRRKIDLINHRLGRIFDRIDL